MLKPHPSSPKYQQPWDTNTVGLAQGGTILGFARCERITQDMVLSFLPIGEVSGSLKPRKWNCAIRLKASNRETCIMIAYRPQPGTSLHIQKHLSLAHPHASPTHSILPIGPFSQQPLKWQSLLWPPAIGQETLASPRTTHAMEIWSIITSKRKSYPEDFPPTISVRTIQWRGYAR